MSKVEAVGLITEIKYYAGMIRRNKNVLSHLYLTGLLKVCLYGVLFDENLPNHGYSKFDLYDVMLQGIPSNNKLMKRTRLQWYF